MYKKKLLVWLQMKINVESMQRYFKYAYTEKEWEKEEYISELKYISETLGSIFRIEIREKNEIKNGCC